MSSLTTITPNVLAPLALLFLVWLRLGLVELRYLFVPHGEDAPAVRLEHLVITSQEDTGRAHEVNVPHDPDSHSEPNKLVVAWLVRKLARTAARGPVAGDQRLGRVSDTWGSVLELPQRS